MKTSAIPVIWFAASFAATAPAPQAAPPLNPPILKAAEYVASYEAQLGGLVAEEEYKQTLLGRSAREAPRQTRKLKSDFMLVRLAADEPLTPFRDVIEVDGKPVSDRTARLERLFLQPAAQAWKSAILITEESARYNLGRLRRNVNVPTLALEYLKPANIGRCRFQAPRAVLINAAAAWKVDFKEQDGPTLIRDSANDGNVPASGTFWIRASDGAVLRTVLDIGGRLVESQTDVRYCDVPKVAVVVPCRMSERINGRADQVEGTATYANIRQFTVTTSEAIKR